MSRAFTAGDFEAGARALVDRWCRDPAAVNASMTVRWGGGERPGEASAAAGGCVAAEGRLVVPERSRTLQNDESDEPPGSSDHEDVEDHHEDHEEDDDDAAAPRTVPARRARPLVPRRVQQTLRMSRVAGPRRLVRARRARHGSRGDGGVARGGGDAGAEGGAEEERRRRAVSLPNVDGERGLTAFAPWEHPARAWRGLGRRRT